MVYLQVIRVKRVSVSWTLVTLAESVVKDRSNCTIVVRVPLVFRSVNACYRRTTGGPLEVLLHGDTNRIRHSLQQHRAVPMYDVYVGAKGTIVRFRRLAALNATT